MPLNKILYLSVLSLFQFLSVGSFSQNSSSKEKHAPTGLDKDCLKVLYDKDVSTHAFVELWTPNGTSKNFEPCTFKFSDYEFSAVSLFYRDHERMIFLPNDKSSEEALVIPKNRNNDERLTELLDRHSITHFPVKFGKNIEYYKMTIPRDAKYYKDIAEQLNVLDVKAVRNFSDFASELSLFEIASFDWNPWVFSAKNGWNLLPFIKLNPYSYVRLENEQSSLSYLFSKKFAFSTNSTVLTQLTFLKDKYLQKKRKPQTPACHIRLFQNGQRVENYFELVKELQVKEKQGFPCQLDFSNSSIIVTEKLGGKGASLILRTRDEKVLRILNNPKQEGDLEEFYKIYKSLSKYKVPIVFTEKPSNQVEKIEYLIHEFIDKETNLYRFQREYLEKLESGDIKKEEFFKSNQFQSFLGFVAKTATYEFIADLHEGNIVRTRGGEWIAMDFGATDPDKFSKPYQNLSYKYFFWNADQLGGLQEVAFRGADKETLERIAKENDWYQNITSNVITDGDIKMKDFMHIPQDWEGPIREKIFAVRVLKEGLLSSRGIQHKTIQKNIHNITTDLNQATIQMSIPPKWTTPKTTVELTQMRGGFIGINGGFWSNPTPGVLKTVKDYLGPSRWTSFLADKTAVPSANLKQDGILVQGANTFWATLGWSNTPSPKAQIDWVKINWYVKLNNKTFSLERKQWLDRESQNEIIYEEQDLSIGQFRAWEISNGIVQSVKEVFISRISSCKGNDCFQFPAANCFRVGNIGIENPNTLIHEAAHIYFRYATPKNQKHDHPTEENHDVWESMSNMVSGKLLMKDGVWHSLENDGFYNEAKEKRQKTFVCLEKSNTIWHAWVAESLGIEEVEPLLRSSDCRDALLLDGGKSSTLALFQNGVTVDLTQNFKRIPLFPMIRTISDAIIFSPKSFATLNPSFARVTSLSAYDSIFCAHRSDESVRCNNEQGTEEEWTRIGIKGISASANYACGLNPDYNAKCWGAGAKNMLQHTFTDESFSKLKVIGSNVCGIKRSDQHILCWSLEGDDLQRKAPRGKFELNSLDHDDDQFCAVQNMQQNSKMICWSFDKDGKPLVRFDEIIPSEQHKIARNHYGFCFINLANQLQCSSKNNPKEQSILIEGPVSMVKSIADTTCWIQYDNTLRCAQTHKIYKSYPDNQPPNSVTNTDIESISPLADEKVIDFALTYHEGCAVTTSGHVQCWGDPVAKSHLERILN